MMAGLPKYGHGGHFMPHLLSTIITCPYLDTGRGKSISEDYHFLLHHVSSSSLSSSSWWSSEEGQGPIVGNQFSGAGFTALVCVHKRRREGNKSWCCRNIKPTTQIIVNFMLYWWKNTICIYYYLPVMFAIVSIWKTISQILKHLILIIHVPVWPSLACFQQTQGHRKAAIGHDPSD